MKPKWILVMVLIVLVVIFALQNVTPVEIRFFSWTMTMSKALLLPVAFLIGVLVGWVASLASWGRGHGTQG